jgi:hypothetical protein
VFQRFTLLLNIFFLILKTKIYKPARKRLVPEIQVQKKIFIKQISARINFLDSQQKYLLKFSLIFVIFRLGFLCPFFKTKMTLLSAQMFSIAACI